MMEDNTGTSCIFWNILSRVSNKLESYMRKRRNLLQIHLPPFPSPINFTPLSSVLSLPSLFSLFLSSLLSILLPSLLSYFTPISYFFYFTLFPSLLHFLPSPFLSSILLTSLLFLLLFHFLIISFTSLFSLS